MLERFTRERQRSSRGVAFGLEEEEDLTHYGQSLSMLDDFDNSAVALDEDSDNEDYGKMIIYCPVKQTPAAHSLKDKLMTEQY